MSLTAALRRAKHVRPVRPAPWPILTTSLALLFYAGVARGQATGMAGMPEMGGNEPPTSDAVSAAMGSSMEDSPHMRMTMLAPAKAGDTEKAAAIVATLRQALEPYEDYHKALAEGFRIFAPRVKQRVYHFSSRRNALLSSIHFDPARPTSLLYERTGDSTYRLVGAMYTAPRRFSLEQLDERVPLSVAQWHLHTNWCIPRPFSSTAYTARGQDGRPLFGGRGSITTQDACAEAGGVFFPVVFGWMVHVHPFATDPAQIWAGEHQD